MLNGLQTNAETLVKSIERKQSPFVKEDLVKTERQLYATGITESEFEKLSIIHVSGTKGKGSTCSLTDSILTCHGIKTGFYCSPHMTYVVERINLSTKPIEKSKFVKYFWIVYEALEKCSDGLPPYFTFLTIMAYHVFIREKVDVAIIEVGMGGEFDCTNIAKNPKTIGITSLGIEHEKILGGSITEIAWQKVGIIKREAHVFTVPQPFDLSMDVINQKCKQTQVIHTYSLLF